VGLLYYQLNHHSTESIVKRRRNPRLIIESELSYSAKRKAIEHRKTDSGHAVLNCSRTCPNLNPVKVADTMKLVVLRRQTEGDFA
jgi:hypothetical protein